LVFRNRQRQPAKILAVADQDIEGVELDLGIVSARVQAVEIGPAINAEQHGFAIEDEGGVAVTERGLSHQDVYSYKFSFVTFPLMPASLRKRPNSSAAPR